jgi:hypothetical protein
MEDNDLKRLKNRVDWFCKNKINAFSPTISPAPKSVERNEIESIDRAVRYFYDNGVREIVVQRKYMGSYCDIYLTKNLEDTYFVSRNAHRIEHIDLTAAIESCRELHKRFDWQNLSMLIIQSELMPWSVMGKGLIDSEFDGYLKAHQAHCRYLTESNLYEKIGKVKNSEAYIAYITDKYTLTAKEMSTKYPAHIIRQYESVTAFRVLNLQEYSESLNIYDTQLSHFGRTGNIYFRPFSILKKIFDDGTELIVNDNLSYGMVNDDEYLHVSIASEDELNDVIPRIYYWFDTLTDDMEEGIVIKPRQAFVKNLPLGLKVRNNKYLVMIYGVDFHERYDYYLRKRNIAPKLDCSVNDWMLNWEMLKVKYKDINEDNFLLKNLVLDRILGENIESTLDMRL